MIKRRPFYRENCTLPDEQKVTEQGQALSILDVMVRVKKGLGTGVCTLRSYLADENDIDDWSDDELTPIDQVEAMEVERDLEESLQAKQRKKRTKIEEKPVDQDKPGQEEQDNP